MLPWGQRWRRGPHLHVTWQGRNRARHLSFSMPECLAQLSLGVDSWVLSLLTRGVAGTPASFRRHGASRWHSAGRADVACMFGCRLSAVLCTLSMQHMSVVLMLLSIAVTVPR
jgi:hypothetical protein